MSWVLGALLAALATGASASEGGFLQARTPAPAIDGYPVNFDLCVGGVCQGSGCFRIEIPATVDGKELNFLLDTGSSTLAVCSGHDLPAAATALPRGETVQSGACALYGNITCGSHGFLGNVYEANLTVGNMTTVQVPGVVEITQAKDNKGNACGAPMPGSLGAVQLDGIFGFGFEGLNNVFCEPVPGGYQNMWSAADLDSGCLSCPQTCTGISHPAPWQTLLWSQVNLAPLQFGISWAGRTGPGSGTLYTGSDAAAMFDRYAELPTTTWVHMSNGLGYYGLDILHYTLKFPNGTEAARVPFTGTALFDTGSPEVNLPQSIVYALASIYSSTAVAVDVPNVRVDIAATAAAGKPQVPLALEINGTVVGQLFRSGHLSMVPDTDSEGMLGLALMLWYEAVILDIANARMGFARRATPQFSLMG